MKSLLYHAFGVKGFRYLRTRYEGGEIIFELEPEKEPEVAAGQKLRRHGYRWRTVRSMSIGLKPHGANSEESPRLIRQATHKIQNPVNDAPGQIAAERAEEHRAHTFAPCLRNIE